MEIDIPQKIEKIENYLVEEKHIADFLGSGTVAVLSTPSMILMMEHTAMIGAHEFLPEGWITVGTRVDISHLRASKQGAEIKVIAKLKKVEGKHLTFEVSAFDGDHKIGEGIHERHIVNKEKFIAKIQ
ncbi:MAG: thioesterase family protein [Candidatus Heimdallarchaeota archaeon]|nr:thioesterase family protein [Candidatus Heimdallarchaeota archaeon]MBY8994950.1 thioesterase family protein [Candidatus Heimdallarchaeota archaeon]